MNEREFLDLLRYYFRKVKPEDVEEILSDYKAHFTEARERGLSDAQIAAELGHPEDIYAFFGMSKKVFKMASGALYKQRKIEFTKTGIRAVK